MFSNFWHVLSYIPLLIIFCIIEYVTNTTLNQTAYHFIFCTQFTIHYIHILQQVAASHYTSVLMHSFILKPNVKLCNYQSVTVGGEKRYIF